MERQVDVCQMQPQLVAVIRQQAALAELPCVIPPLCGEVWQYARAAALPKPGRHVSVYHVEQQLLECGAEVTAPFAGNERVVCSQTPGGLAATTTHFGPYQLLPDVHAAVRAWCADNGHALAGVWWEIYGNWENDWNDNPAKIRTDVYYLLRPAAS
jgi:effector-binding domain-containing protein